MKVYVDENYEVYTEETIDKEIAQRFGDYNYDGVVEYITDTYSEAEIFAMLSPNSQLKVLEYLKESELDNSFFEREVDGPLPCNRCPFAK